MDLGIEGRVALLTGASRGIGHASAAALAAEGARVAICARGREAVEAAARDIAARTGGEVAAFVADTSQANDIDRLLSEVADTVGSVDTAECVRFGMDHRLIRSLCPSNPGYSLVPPGRRIGHRSASPG